MKKYRNIAVVLGIIALWVFVPVNASAQAWKWKRTNDGLVYEINNDSTITIINWKGKSTHVVIPDAIDGLPVEKVYSFYLFYGNQKKIRSLVLSKNLQELFFGSSVNVDHFYKKSQLTVVEIPFGFDAKDEFSLPHYFSDWFNVHGRRAGTYTYKDNAWYLDGKLPAFADYAILRVSGTSFVSVDSVSAVNFRLRERTSRGHKDSYVLPPGSYDITYSVYGKDYIENVLLEAGKYDIEPDMSGVSRRTYTNFNQGSPGRTYTTQQTVITVSHMRLIVTKLEE